MSVFHHPEFLFDLLFCVKNLRQAERDDLKLRKAVVWMLGEFGGNWTTGGRCEEIAAGPLLITHETKSDWHIFL